MRACGGVAVVLSPWLNLVVLVVVVVLSFGRKESGVVGWLGAPRRLAEAKWLACLQCPPRSSVDLLLRKLALAVERPAWLTALRSVVTLATRCFARCVGGAGDWRGGEDPPHGQAV